jgi:hypothetical protein
MVNGALFGLWGYLLQAILDIISWLIVSFFPIHEYVGMSDMAESTLTSIIPVTFVVVNEYYSMLYPITFIMLMFVLEAVRFIYATWRWVKRIIID